jgi:DHA2 family multidrug resistance protein-like MFS transporter
VWSALLNGVAVTLLIRGIDGIGIGQGWARVTVELSAAFLFGVALVWRQSHLEIPMLAVDLFKRPIFALSVSASLCAFVAQGLAVVVLPFYFIDVMNFSQVQAGLLLSPWPVAAGITSHYSGRLADRIPIRVLGTIGIALMTTGLVLLAYVGAHPTMWQILWRAALGGAGFGIFGAPNNRAMVASAPKERSGGAGGISTMSRLLGQSIGVSIVAVVFERTAHGDVSLHGVFLALMFGAAFTAISGFISAAPLPHFHPE